MKSIIEERPAVRQKLLPRPLLLFLLAIVFAGGPARAEEFTEIVLALDADGTFSFREFYAQCNEKLGTRHVQEDTADRRLRLGAIQRLALLSASQLAPELVQVRFGDRQVVLRFPDVNAPDARSRARRRAERLLGVRLEQWPAGAGLRLPRDLQSGRRSVLLIHGVDASPHGLTNLRQAFQEWGIQVLVYDYPNDGPVADTGIRLREDLLQLHKKRPDLRLVIVSHSMGGLVARYVLEASGQAPPNITDVFMLGTPHAGSTLAGAEPWLELLEMLSPKPNSTDEPEWNRFLDGLGEAAEDLQPGSKLLANLREQSPPDKVRYFAAAGSAGVLKRDQQGVFAAKVEERLRGRQPPSDATQLLLRCIRAEELQEGKGDGMVTVASALDVEADGKETFPLDHWQLVRPDPAHPEKHPVFRWIVETLSWERPHGAAP
jgi:pimeloyl-ACP methyl ester carboxylesterase